MDMNDKAKADMTNVRIKDGGNSELIALLREFRIALQENPFNKSILEKVFDKIKPICNGVNGLSIIVTEILSYLNGI